MAPIHETDVDENRGADSSRHSARWSQEEWKDYELWEKIDARERRRRKLWVLGAALLFFALLAVPVWWERSPLWRANQAALRLARELSLAKKEAALEGSAVRVTLQIGQPGLQIKKERLSDCGTARPERTPERREETVVLRAPSAGLEWLPADRALDWSVPDVITSLCYDPVAGADGSGNFAIISAKDLAIGRSDRVAILQASGSGADLRPE